MIQLEKLHRFIAIIFLQNYITHRTELQKTNTNKKAHSYWFGLSSHYNSIYF